MQTDWDYINKKIKQSKIKRVNWKRIFGKSLTAIITDLIKKGWNSDKSIAYLINKLNNSDFYITNKIIDNLKISVRARYAEQKMAKKRMEV